MLGSGGLHDDFYTNANIKAAYKNYVKAVVTRYSSSEPAIFSWQLTNEVYSDVVKDFACSFLANHNYNQSFAAKGLLRRVHLVTPQHLRIG